MSTNNKILGRLKPAAATPSTLYTVPGSTQANANLFCANQSPTTDDTIRVAITPSGQSLATTDYLVYDITVKAGQAENITGIALAAGDFITVRSTNGDVSFVATGIEVN